MHIFSFGDRRESTVRIYEMMRRSKWGSTLEANEFVVKVLGKGFRSLGEQSLVVDVKGLTRGQFGKIESVENILCTILLPVCYNIRE